MADLANLAAERPGDSMPCRERCELAARCAFYRPDVSERLHWEMQAIAFQREAVARSDTAAERNRLNIAYETVFLNHANRRHSTEARAILLEWSELWPEWPEHALRIA